MRVHRLEKRTDARRRLVVELAEGARLEGPKRGAAHEARLVAVGREELTHLELDELEKLRVGDVHLVDEADEVIDTQLAGEQHVLAGLGLDALTAVDEEDAAVHLAGAGDHVLHEVGVTGTVDVGVDPPRRLVADVARDDGDAAALLLGGTVDLGKGPSRATVKMRGHRREGGGEGGLAVVDVADGADADVLLRDVHFAIDLHFSFRGRGIAARGDSPGRTSPAEVGDGRTWPPAGDAGGGLHLQDAERLSVWQDPPARRAPASRP